jgi:hypothetical protein
MPYGGNDWLALTQEPTLEPEIPICDPHHHFWDLRPEHIPYQRYLLHELAADVHCDHRVRFDRVYRDLSTMIEKGPLAMLEKSPPPGYEARGGSGFLSHPAFCFSRRRDESPLMLSTTR